MAVLRLEWWSGIGYGGAWSQQPGGWCSGYPGGGGGGGKPISSSPQRVGANGHGTTMRVEGEGMGEEAERRSLEGKGEATQQYTIGGGGGGSNGRRRSACGISLSR